MTFLAAPNHARPTESDANNTYLLTVQATDGNGGATTQTIIVTVLYVDNTAPAVIANEVFAYAENQAANAAAGTVAATDNLAVTAFRFASTATRTSADGFIRSTTPASSGSPRPAGRRTTTSRSPRTALPTPCRRATRPANGLHRPTSC